MMTNDRLVQAVKRLGQGAAEARAWVKTNAATAPSVANQAQALVNATRQAENLSRKLAGAADRRVCVGVFGPSQAGKSYLVSALARRPGESLTCDFAGDRKDFLRDINPPGDRESTGLVTRFTTTASTADPAFPVELRLLSETDIVKILANAYFSDFDANNQTLVPPDAEAIRGVIAAAEAAAGAAVAHLDEIVMFDLSEYFERYFRSRIEVFRQTGYWEALIRLGGRLPLRARADLYAPLWGAIPDLTKLFLHLAAGLDRLGHAPEARAAIEALVPRERSIIDVFTLKRLGTAEDDADRIKVQPAGGGTTADLPRGQLAALVAELKISVTETAWDFMRTTDLLDFPGARSREKMLAMASDEAERGQQVRGLFLRGKIAYLFQRFTEERELTSMLLCMPNNPAEVKDLAAMVKGWIDLTHGPEPEQRAGLRNALFLVLTKFDLEFIEKGGETSEARRAKWDRRLFASFIEPYGHSKWPENWDGKPFANTLFLRNPGMKQEHIMEYAEIRRLPDGSDHLVEARPAAAKQGLIDEYRNAFMTSDLCAKHFADRDAAWNAAFQPNDGGISFLVRRLTETLDAELKTRQIGERVIEQARALRDLLRRFHHADDDAGRRQKDEAIKTLLDDLFEIADADYYHPFTRLLDHLRLREREVRETFLNVAALKVEAAPAPPQPARRRSLWDEDDGEAAAPAAAAAPPTADRPALFARDVMNQWTEKLRRIGQAASVLEKLNLPARLVDALVGELIVAANRQDIGAQIAQGVRAMQAAHIRWEEAADRAVGIATTTLNDYVGLLGLAGMDPAERPKVRNRRPVFAGPPPFDGLPELKPGPYPMAAEYFMDWVTGLRQLALDNAGHDGGREIDAVQNAQLGRILDTIDPASMKAA